MSKLSEWLREKIIWGLGSTIVYVACLVANQWLAHALGWGDANNWMLLTGGVQMVLVLVLVDVGVWAIGVGSVLFYSFADPAASPLFIVMTASVQALAPLLARHLAMDLGGMQSSLAGLRAKQLLYLCWLFAVVSAALTQVWLTWYDPSHDFLQSIFIMVSSYWLGTACVLSLLSLSAKKFYAWVQQH